MFFRGCKNYWDWVSSMEHFTSELLRLQEQAASSLLNKNEPFETVSFLIKELNSIRSQLPRSEWKELIQEYCQTHSLKELLLQDPFTRRAFEKPRRYAGDAIMLDYIYAADGSMNSPSFENETEFGRWIHPYLMEMPALEDYQKKLTYS